VPGYVGKGRARIELDSKPVLLGVNVGERLSLRGTGKAAMIVMIANRTREIRPSGMTMGASGNVGHGGIVTPPRNRKGEPGNPPPIAERARDLSRPTQPDGGEGLARRKGVTAR
jgi:hypothetical protein